MVVQELLSISVFKCYFCTKIQEEKLRPLNPLEIEQIFLLASFVKLYFKLDYIR